MAKNLLNKNGEFVVGEEKLLNYILALLFFAFFIYGLIDAIKSHFKGPAYLTFLLLAPAIFFLIKARSKRIFIRINKTGIYQDGQLVTTWTNFINAWVTQKQVLMSIQDNFILVVEYLKDGDEKGFRRKIPLTNTQNKSEEDVLEAVKFFWNEYRKDFAMANEQ